MKKGQILFIPAYWWYSIEFGENTSVCTFKYKTYMNMVAISPHIIMNLLQSQNVKRDNLKKIITEQPLPMPMPMPMPIHLVNKNIINPPETIIPREPAVLPSETSLHGDSIPQ